MKTVMKLLIVFIISLAMITGGCGSSPSASAPASAAIDELDMAIRDASDYLNENIPKGNKIVILNIESNSLDLSNYIIDELIANAVNDRGFTVVDRQQLDKIRAEQNFQLSGEVADNDALAIGRFFGAQTIVSGAVNRLGTGYRIRIRALEVQTAQVQGQYNRNIASSPMVTALMASGSSSTVSSAASTTATVNSRTAPTAPSAPVQSFAPTVQGTPAQSPTPTAQTAPAESSAQRAPEAPPSPPTPAAPPIEGTNVPGNSLTDKLAWLQRSADSHNTYILEVNANENIAPYTFEFSGGINITVVLRGNGANRTIRLRSNETMFKVYQNVTFILDNNITLQGHNGNSGVMVYVYSGGTFKMNTGSAITGNNSTTSYGGGVYNSGIFEMNGGTISGNNANSGGGVFNSGTFTMNDGIISGNTANRGGGVFHYGGTFSMRSGTISGNTAREYGGGVWLDSPLAKNGGVITGYSSDQSNGNVVKDIDGYILARRGHALFVNENLRKETTARTGDNLSYGGTRGTAGAWDQ